MGAVSARGCGSCGRSTVEPVGSVVTAMDYEEWAPVYARIRADFGYPLAADEHARDVLAGLVEQFPEEPLRRLLDGATVAIAGAGSSLEAERSVAADADAVVAASTAADRLDDVDVGVDLVVTDLDKHPASAVAFADRGVPVAIHAHGDNVELVCRWVPRADPTHVLGTTQAEPRGPVANYGGFTDGDRAAFIADHYGAAALSFPGWDLGDPDVGPTKRRKLVWAERLLHWLERRRGERFSPLDGRRDAITDPIDTACDG